MDVQEQKNRYHRRSVRLKDYDYSRAGAYYVTICSAGREMLFGKIDGGAMMLSENGLLVEKLWNETPSIRPGITLGEYVVMPDHIHGIIWITEPGCRGVSQYAPTKTSGQVIGFKSPSGNLGAIIRGFKAAVTKHINISRNSPGQPVWQRGFYEHVIRNNDELERIIIYIKSNPLRWESGDAGEHYE